VQQTVGEFEIEWALGAAIKEASDLARAEGGGALNADALDAPGNGTLRVVVLLVVVAIAAVAWKQYSARSKALPKFQRSPGPGR
jgi:hypothetical protein